MHWFLPALFIVVESVGVASAAHALFTVRTPQGTVAWVIGLIAFPWLGLPLYWFFGSRRFEAHSRVMQRALITHEAKIHEVRQEMTSFFVPREEVLPVRAGDLAAIAGDDFMHGNKLDLLIDGEATFGAILEEIAKAQHSINLEFYIMREDGLGTRLLEALAARAVQGVDVRFLLDKLGSVGITPSIIQKWRSRGVRMATFCADSGWRERWRLNFRNHRKIVIVDGKAGFVGGHNVGDEYLGLDPKFGRWRDTHVRIEGPSVMQLQMIFAADWLFATGEPLEGRWEAQPVPGNEKQRALFLASGPSDHFERCTLFFLNVISMAERRLWIASPYFVPDEAVMQALQLAAIRGVDVRILVPSKPDHVLVWLASFALKPELDHPNIHFHRFTGGFLHQKALLVDQSFAGIGTANFDNRSFRLNFEITLAIADPAFAAKVTTMFESDFAESAEIERGEYESRPFYFKVGARAAWLLAPIL